MSGSARAAGLDLRSAASPEYGGFVELGLDKKVALITGVSQGIGLACATSLLAEGALVLGTSRSAPPALNGLTHLPLDMSEPGAGERAVSETIEQLGALDILVNNVG